MRSTNLSPTRLLMAFDVAAMNLLDPVPSAPADRIAATILVVEPNPLVREMLAAGLALHQPAWRVEAMATAEEVVSRIATSPSVDLLVLELALPEPKRGAELLATLHHNGVRPPVLLLTGSPEEAWRRGVDVDAVVVKPPDMDVLLGRIERLLAVHRGSVVRGFALATLLQMFEIERKDCTLTVSTAEESGRIWVRQGRLVDARAGLASGRNAFFEMLDWAAPEVHVLDSCDLPLGRAESMQELMLQHAIDRDHGGRA